MARSRGSVSDEMRELDSGEKIRAAEVSLLRALCQETLSSAAREDVRSHLARYTFYDPFHQVLFEALKEIKPESRDPIRQQLIARLTAKGFPDVELETYFRPDSLSAAEAVELARRLAALPEESEVP